MIISEMTCSRFSGRLVLYRANPSSNTDSPTSAEPRKQNQTVLEEVIGEIGNSLLKMTKHTAEILIINWLMLFQTQNVFFSVWGHMRVEQHEGEQPVREFSFWSELSL